MQRTTSTTSAHSTRREQGCSGCFAWVFALAFLGAGGAMFYFMTYRPLSRMSQSGDWISTPCEIVSSQLKRDDDNSSVDIVFKYTVDQQEYQSSQYCFMQISSNTSTNWKGNAVANNPAGKKTNCFVNPRDPSDAVIDRGWVPDMWWGVFPVPFALIGFCALLAALGIIKLPNSKTLGPSGWKPNSSRSEDNAPESEESGEPVVLTPTSAITALMGAIIAALVWNGILSIFLWPQVQQFMRAGFGGLEFGTCLILTPFTLIGFGLILLVCYTFLCLFNPRPVLTVNTVTIPLAETLKVSWVLNGSPHSIRKFRISVKGVEKATYQRGTTTTTDESTFADITIFETEDPYEMAEGNEEFEFPADTMHSFNAPNNKIEWKLNIKGDIPMWPDVGASFPITVQPQNTSM